MFCERVKEFLSQRHIEFTERNIAADPSALAELEILGLLTTPVTVLGGEVIVGFDRQRLEALVELGRQAG